MNRSVQLGVIGGGAAAPRHVEAAYEVGRRAAVRGWVVITGGLGGVMAAASRGAAEAGGATVGILPTYDAGDANEYVRIVIPTGLGHARNVLIAAAADGLIAIAGQYGTFSEIALALKLGKPVVGIDTALVLEGFEPVTDAAAAVEKIAAFVE